MYDCIGAIDGTHIPYKVLVEEQARFCGKYYLVDASYRNMSGFLAPYQNTWYHLNEIRGWLPKSPKEIFNHRNSALRNVVERAFGVLKKRWAILDSTQHFDFPTQVSIVIACCVPHNHIMGADPNDAVTQQGIWDTGARNSNARRSEPMDDAPIEDNLTQQIQRNELAK
ncbi:PREDICTED: uncharacterized protein LOC109114241 [Nelumbo nucifera]|uniref:Uncharacterized protein LOC109114241 n=1 Tax=Nelumbo nucifera TaxID=4432 RepID=A0A1U8Q280_NELNU|nr:PREDICTED: uncharacterized protein LOC109114241 [Nelumbo nucifera]